MSADCGRLPRVCPRKDGSWATANVETERPKQRRPLPPLPHRDCLCRNRQRPWPCEMAPCWRSSIAGGADPFHSSGAGADSAGRCANDGHSTSTSAPPRWPSHRCAALSSASRSSSRRSAPTRPRSSTNSPQWWRAPDPTTCKEWASVPRIVEFEAGRVVSTSRLPSPATNGAVDLPLADVPLRHALEGQLGVPVFVDNDAHVAALAEAQSAGSIVRDAPRPLERAPGRPQEQQRRGSRFRALRRPSPGALIAMR
jgi:hypothetical protein